MNMGLRTFSQALSLFRDLDPEMQAPAIATFITIANADGDISMQDIQTATGMPSSSTTRNVQIFCELQRLGKPGHNLVETYEDLNDRRRKLVKLTPKGKTFKARLLGITG